MVHRERLDPTLAFVYGFIATALAVVLTERVAAAVADWSGAGLVFCGLALVQFGAIAAVVSSRLGRPNRLVGVSMFTAVPVGVLLDVIFDSLYSSNDRNLFPFEIVFFWIAALGPALLASLRMEEIDRLIGLAPPKSPR